MQVLRVGTKNQATCGACDSLLQFAPSDLHLVHRPINAGPWDVETMPEPEDHYQGVVTCPVCKGAVSVTTTRQQRQQLLAQSRQSDHNL